MSATEAARPTRFEPPASETTKPFWDATREGKFLLQWCTACDAPVFYPREICPACLGSSLEWRPAGGDGTVYAVSVQHKPQNPMMRDRAPYPVALVELAEGPRIMTNIVNCDPYDVTVGAAVTLTWEPLSDGRNLPLFELASTNGSKE